MAKSSKIYWAARQRQLNKALQKAEKDLTKRLSAFYSKESAKLDKEIAAYYAELGEDNVVEYRKMLQHMSDADRKLLMERMDDFAKKYPEKAHLMPTRASIYKLDRLEGLQTSTKLHQMEIGAKTEEEVTRHLKQTAARSANAAAETLTGKGGSLYELNSPLVEKIVGTNWANGVSYSDRIWNNTSKLADKLNNEIAAGFVRGDSYDKLSKQLMTEMNIRNRSDAERLIYTEGTHVMNEASISVFQEAGFDQYIISPLPDACEYCQEIAGEQNALVERERSGVPISERVAGENFPPLHPWCRCSYEIYLSEESNKKLDNGASEYAKTLENTTYSAYNRTRERNALKSIPYESYTEPMTKKHVRSVMKDMDVDFGKAKIFLDKREELIGSGFLGYTNPNQREVHFYPDAFMSREELVKTIAHENEHLRQLRLYGPTNNTDLLAGYEEQARSVEESAWRRYVERTGYNP